MDLSLPDIVLIGAGNLATQLGKALRRSGFRILQVYSRTQRSADLLSAELECESAHELTAVRKDADIYIFSVTDDALEGLIPQVTALAPEALFLHTAGSMPIDLFKGHVHRYGVLYPMHTFSRSQDVDFTRIACFLEASSEEVMRHIRHLASHLSPQLYELNSEKRRHLHLAAVFACNFSNHLYTLSRELLQAQGIPFEVMLPLIEETVHKIHHLSPRQAQTGPALRGDKNVMEAHLKLLEASPEMQEIYRLLSQSIHQYTH